LLQGENEQVGVQREREKLKQVHCPAELSKQLC